MQVPIFLYLRLVNWLNPNTSFTDDFYVSGRYKLAWRLSVAFTFIFGILATLFFNIEKTGFFIYLSVFFLSLGSLFYLHRTKHSKAVFWIFTVGATTLIIFSMNTILHTMHYSDILWMICVILFAFIGLTKRAALFFIVVNVLGLIYFILVGLNTHLELVKPLTSIELTVVTIEMVFAFFIMSYLIFENIRYQSHVGVELTQVNQLLAQKNKENITLLKEVHHRVKNNLQIVISLLRMQNADINSEETKLHFNEAINRIMTISMIHRKLYQTGELSRLEFNKYISALIEDIKSLHTNNSNIKIDLTSNLEELDLKTVVPLGLIINELITNSIKHAFSENEQGTITIAFTKTPDNIVVLDYSDSGRWKEPSKNGFGLELLSLLTEQLDGKFKRNESLFRIDFPIQEEK